MTRREVLRWFLGVVGSFWGLRCGKLEREDNLFDGGSDFGHGVEPKYDSGKEPDTNLGHDSLTNYQETIFPHFEQISVLEDLKRKIGQEKIVVTYEYGDPYVVEILGVAFGCLYFTVNGKPYLGEGIHVESVYVDPKRDIVRWYCNGKMLDV